MTTFWLTLVAWLALVILLDAALICALWLVDRREERKRYHDTYAQHWRTR